MRTTTQHVALHWIEDGGVTALAAHVYDIEDEFGGSYGPGRVKVTTPTPPGEWPPELRERVDRAASTLLGVDAVTGQIFGGQLWYRAAGS